MDQELIEEELTGAIIACFYEVYNTLGYGFLEFNYARALQRELRALGYDAPREKEVTVMYKGEPLSQQRVDMLVEGKVIVEIKSTERLPPTSIRQLYNYLKATNLEVGLLLHFGPEPKFYRQIHRKDVP